MLFPAIRYADDLVYEFERIWFDEKYKYYFNAPFFHTIEIIEDSCEEHQFVSYHYGDVIGYISYSVDRAANVAFDMNIINFSDNKAIFGIDVMQAIDDIFCKYNFDKLEFSVFIGNPAEKMYDKFIKMTGGRIVGTYKKHQQLMDGKVYDLKMYEVFRKKYIDTFKRGKYNEKEKTD